MYRDFSYGLYNSHIPPSRYKEKHTKLMMESYQI